MIHSLVPAAFCSAILLSSPVSRAGDDPTPSPGLRGPSSSPFAPPEADDRTFVVNVGQGLDTGCTYRSGGPLQITIPVNRYLGPTDSEGYLLDVDALVVQGRLKRYVEITFPAWDIDFDAGPT